MSSVDPTRLDPPTQRLDSTRAFSRSFFSEILARFYSTDVGSAGLLFRSAAPRTSPRARAYGSRVPRAG
jgi:hypothetical protein